VDFYAKTKLDLNRVLQVRESEWSSELRARTFLLRSLSHVLGVAEGAKQLGAVDMNDLCSGEINIDDVRKKFAPDFVQTFRSLLTIMENQETKLQMKEAKERSQSNSQSVSGSTSTDALPSGVASRTQSSPDISSEPRTPDQPTHPSNPKWSGSSTASQDEEATKKLLSRLLWDTMTILEADFRMVNWQKSGLKVELTETLLLHLP
jgi:hypothetical protein